MPNQPEERLTPKILPMKGTRLPTVLDNTQASCFHVCPRRFFYAHLCHLYPLGTSIHLHAGKAYASGLEHFRTNYEQSKNAEEAIAAGFLALTRQYGLNPEIEEDLETPKSYIGMASAYLSAVKHWSPASDYIRPHIGEEGKPMVECSGAIELKDTHPDTGEPLLYHGRYDMLGDYKNSVFVVDDKTTSSLGSSWAKQWNLRSQFTGYSIIADQNYHVNVSGSIIRGTAILKTKITHAEAIIYHPDEIKNAWWGIIGYTTAQMKGYAKVGYWPMLGMFNGGCYHYFRECEFMALCRSKAPERWLSDYRVRIWDPTNPSD